MPYRRRSRRQIAQRRREQGRARPTPGDSANLFDLQMRTLNFAICSRSNKRVKATEIMRNLCSTCRKSRINLFSGENGMDLGEIPGELRGLSMIEEILIARVHPVVSVFRIRGQHRAYSGHVMNFAQHVENFATRLPHDPCNINSVIIINRDTPNGLIEFRVRSSRVRDALIWLKANNQYYRDIVIDNHVLAGLPIDGDVSDLLPRIENLRLADQENEHPPDNIKSGSGFPNLPVINEERVIQQNLQEQLFKIGAQ